MVRKNNFDRRSGRYYSERINTRSRRKAVREDYDFTDTYDEYEGLDEAINYTESLCNALDKFLYLANSVKELNFDDSNNSIEAFSGPSDARAFADFTMNILDSISPLYAKYWEFIARRSGLDYDTKD
jgi:hypothetical protein